MSLMPFGSAPTPDASASKKGKVQLAGDLTGTAASPALANTAVTPGSYTSTNLTVDAKGRLTAASNGAGGSGSPGGANTQIQFNDSGVFGGTSDFTFNKTTKVGTLGAAGTGTITVPGGANSEQFGALAVAPGARATAIGNTAKADFNDCVALGSTARNFAIEGTAIGAGTRTLSSGGVALGYGAFSDAQNALSIGSLCVAVGVNSFAFGRAAYAGGNGDIALGPGASASGGSSITMLGTVTGATAVAIGTGSSAAGTWAVAIGNGANAGHLGSVAIGITSTTTAAGQFVCGNPNGPFTDIYFGRGVTDGAPGSYTIRGTGGSGTNITGGDVKLQGGIPTGTGLYGSVILNGTGGLVGVGVAAPTAALHIKAGTATANTAPLKLTTGTNLTTAEVGAMEYNNTFHLTNSDATRRHVVTAPNTTKTTAGAPYTNDGYVTVNIGGTDFKLMTTA